jgi:hypothetical protein
MFIKFFMFSSSRCPLEAPCVLVRPLTSHTAISHTTLNTGIVGWKRNERINEG